MAADLAVADSLLVMPPATQVGEPGGGVGREVEADDLIGLNYGDKATPHKNGRHHC